MLEVISALKGYAIEASDGRIGSVSDFLFDVGKWQVRWLVVDTGDVAERARRCSCSPPPSCKQTTNGRSCR